MLNESWMIKGTKSHRAHQSRTWNKTIIIVQVHQASSSSEYEYYKLMLVNAMDSMGREGFGVSAFDRTNTEGDTNELTWKTTEEHDALEQRANEWNSSR